MTAATVGALLEDTSRVLSTLMRGYESLWRTRQTTDEALAEFALFLSSRERHTITALEGYRERHEHLAALDVHVRLGAGFPFDPNDLEIPQHPTLDELAELAERTDLLLEHLGERIAIYAASGELSDLIEALEELADARRRELSDALNELEKHCPSPKHSRQ